MMRRIHDAYGFAFPPDLLRFWKIARGHGEALFEAGVRLAGPFVILAGGKPSKDLDRWASDPPELFTVAEGHTDGLHWGYVLHDPGVAPGHVASFYARDGYPIEADAATLAHAIGHHVDGVRGDMEDELEGIRKIGEDDCELAARIALLAKLGAALAKAVGRSKKRFPPKKEAVPSLDGLGIRAPRSAFASRLDTKKLRKELRNPKKQGAWLARGHELVASQKAGTALQIARDALAVLPTEKQDRAVLLAVAAYEALGRPLLARTFAPRLAAIARRTRSKKPPKIDNRISHSLERAQLDPKRVERLILESWGEQGSLPVLDEIARFENLEMLVLRGYRLGDLPKSFAALRKLREVELFECGLTTIPKVLASLDLESLEIVQSVGTRAPRKQVRLPKGFKLPKLRSLKLVACGLREVPAFVMGAKRLRMLDLSGNHLRELPEEMGALTGLGYLSVSENALTTLPGSFAKLRKLTSLWLGDNRLASAPEVMGTLPLESLDVGKNPLAKSKDERARLKKLAPHAKIYFT